MRILPVSAFNFDNRFSSNAAVSRPSFEEKHDTVSFSGLFRSKEAVSQEDRIASEHINAAIERTQKSLKTVTAQMRRHFFIMSEMYKVGEENHYFSYTNFGDEKDHEKLIFGAKDPETNIPVSLTHVKMEDGLQSVTPIKEYNLYPNGLFNVQLFTMEGYDVSMTGTKNELLYYRERNKETGVTKELHPSKGGFCYFEGVTNEDGETLETICEIQYFKKDMALSSVVLPDDSAPYKYDKSAHVWKKTK